MLIVDRMVSNIVTAFARKKLGIKTVDVDLHGIYLNRSEEQNLVVLGCKGAEIIVDEDEIQNLPQKLQLV